MRVRADTRRLVEPLSGGREGATVTVEPLKAGEFQVPRALLEGSKHLATARMLGVGTPRSRWVWVPVPAFIIHHPTAGPFVVDTASSATSSVFDSGLPLQRTDWIRDGELAALLQTRHTAELTGLAATPGIDNLALEDAEIQQLFASAAAPYIIANTVTIVESAPFTRIHQFPTVTDSGP